MNKREQIIEGRSIERKILLNPGPATTAASVKLAQCVPDICPREKEFGEVLQSICDGLLKIGKATNSHKVALFASSGTGAMEAVLSSAVGNTNRILILTNGAYSLRFAEISKCMGIQYDTLFDFGEYPSLDRLKKQLSSKSYSHVVMIHHETSTGMLNPLEDISELCSDMRVRLIVDAMSSFGAYPIDFSTYKIDYLISSSNKCIHGLAGLSFVIFHESCIPELKANARGYYFNVFEQWNALRTKKQMRFTSPVQVCYAFKKAVEETLIESVEKRRERYTNNWQLLYNGMIALGFRNFLKPEYESNILLALHMDLDFDFNGFHDFLFERGITIYPGVIPQSNTFRVAIIGDLYKKDIEFVLHEMGRYFDTIS